jgi:hypothetical protein
VKGEKEGERGEGRERGDTYVCVLCIFINAGLLVGNSMCERYDVMLQCEACWGLELYSEVVR